MLPAQIWWQDPMKFSSAFLFPTQYRKNKEKNKQTKLYLYYLSYTIICRVARKIFAQFDKWNCRVHYSWEIKEMFVGKCPCKQIMLQQLICFFYKEGNGRNTNIKRAVPVSLGLGQPWSAMSDLAHLSTIFLCDLDLEILMIRKLRDYLVGRLTRSYQISTVWDSWEHSNLNIVGLDGSYRLDIINLVSNL